MARPREKHDTVYRVLIDRPRSKDSVIRWTHKSLPALKRQYGDRLLQVEEYFWSQKIYSRTRPLKEGE